MPSSNTDDNVNNLGADEDSSPMLGFVNKAGFSPYSKSLNQHTPSSPNVNPEDNSRLSNSSPPRKKDLSSSPLCRLKKCQIESPQESEPVDDDNDDFGQAANNNADTDVNLDLFECNLNQELKNLMKMHEKTKAEIA